jgi:hypothetical protein
MIGRLCAYVFVAGSVLIVTSLVSGRRDALAAATAARYEEVKEWPNLPPSVRLGEVAGVAVDVTGHVFVFHRPGRGFALAETTKLAEPAVLEIDAILASSFRHGARTRFLCHTALPSMGRITFS